MDNYQDPGAKDLALQKIKSRIRKNNQAEYDVIVYLKPIE